MVGSSRRMSKNITMNDHVPKIIGSFRLTIFCVWAVCSVIIFIWFIARTCATASQPEMADQYIEIMFKTMSLLVRG